MPIEAAMRETCGFHYFRHADRVEPLVAKQSAGNLQNPAAVLRHLFSTDFHFKILHRHH
jgi:hypothetical protein